MLDMHTRILAQVFNIWMCKTTKTSVFVHGFFRNPTMLGGVALEMAIMFLFVSATASCCCVV